MIKSKRENFKVIKRYSDGSVELDLDNRYVYMGEGILSVFGVSEKKHGQ